MTLIAALAILPVAIPSERLTAVLSGRHRAFAVIPDLGSSAVQKAAEKELKAYFSTELAEYKKFGREVLDGFEGQDPAGTVVYEGSTVVSINQPDGVSLYAASYYDYLGAHPNRTMKPRVWVMSGGQPKLLKAADILKSPMLSTAREFLMPRLQAQEAGFMADEEEGRLYPHVPEAFLPTPAGISWVFEPYAVDAYARGDVVVKAPWGEASSILRPDAPLTAFAGHAAGKVQLLQKIMLPEGTMATVRVKDGDGTVISTMETSFRGGSVDFSVWYPKLNQPSGAQMTLEIEVPGRYSAKQALSPSRVDRGLELTLRAGAQD